MKLIPVLVIVFVTLLQAVDLQKSQLLTKKWLFTILSIAI